jgi:hypothetical protein
MEYFLTPFIGIFSLLFESSSKSSFSGIGEEAMTFVKKVIKADGFDLELLEKLNKIIETKMKPTKEEDIRVFKKFDEFL